MAGVLLCDRRFVGYSGCLCLATLVFYYTDMAKYIEIEITARSEGESWNWRVVNAKQPRGILPADLLPADTKVGEIFHAEIQSGLDGIDIVSVTKPETLDKKKLSDDTLVIGSKRNFSRKERDYADYTNERDSTADAGSPVRERISAKRSSDRNSAKRNMPRRQSDPGRRGSQEKGGESMGNMGRRHDPIRRILGTQYRNAVLAQLRPEQLPIAEELLRGGMPAVRERIEKQNEDARRNSKPLIASEPLITMAEELLPSITLANWKDRASAARSLGSDIPLYELRSIVVATNSIDLDEEASELAGVLKTMLHERIEALRTRWEEQITRKIDKGDIIDAIKLSSTPPDRSFKIPGDLAVRLAEIAGNALSPEREEEEWMEIIEAVLQSPVRRNVKPLGLPANATNELRARLYRAAGLIPGVSSLIGLSMPPPPVASGQSSKSH